MKRVESIPNAQRTFRALRSLGYDLNSSIADIVDNSINPRVSSKNIKVKIGFNEEYEIVCRIIDDGNGMNRDQLIEAMRIGSDSTYTKGDLGKFGLGMKTASLSHCNILTVISKSKDSEINGCSWNLGEISKSQEWSLLELSKNEINTTLNREKINLGKSGTIILWDQLFNLNREYNSYKNEKLAQNFLFRKIEEIKLHLRMVFHRFLDSSYGKSLSIFLNEEKLQPWDPFCLSEDNTTHVKLKPEDSNLYIDGYEDPVEIHAYVLPAKSDFSSLKAWSEAKGLLSWNDSQGYYIYRANRLIRFGGWHGTRAKDEHSKLARISIDISPEMDTEFSLTVHKKRVNFPEELFQHLKNQINNKAVNLAQSQYRRIPEKKAVKNRVRTYKPKFQKISNQLLNESKIKTSKSNEDGGVQVKNNSGTWLSNKLSDFLKYGNEDYYEIVSDHIENGHLWKIVCDPNDKFKVIINSSHPFYTKMYEKSKSKELTEAIDILMFSLAFSELYNKNNNNSHLFETFKTAVSKAVNKIIEEKLI